MCSSNGLEIGVVGFDSCTACSLWNGNFKREMRCRRICVLLEKE